MKCFSFNVDYRVTDFSKELSHMNFFIGRKKESLKNHTTTVHEG